jgi:hypothetical protein
MTVCEIDNGFNARWRTSWTVRSCCSGHPTVAEAARHGAAIIEREAVDAWLHPQPDTAAAAIDPALVGVPTQERT